MKEIDPNFIIFTDGASRGNPGEAAYSFIIYDKNLNLIYREAKKIGRTTNNVAEYTAVIEALKWLKQNLKIKNPQVNFFLDSQLIAQQLNLKYKVKDAKMKILFQMAKDTEVKINGRITYTLIPRERNKEADRLANWALDAA